MAVGNDARIVPSRSQNRSWSNKHPAARHFHKAKNNFHSASGAGKGQTILSEGRRQRWEAHVVQSKVNRSLLIQKKDNLRNVIPKGEHSIIIHYFQKSILLARQDHSPVLNVDFKSPLQELPRAEILRARN